jgi:uncharacterized protein (DUF885 family)
VTSVHDLLHRLVDEEAALDPIDAIERGVVGSVDRLTDFSPEGLAERAALAARWASLLRSTAAGDDHERIALDYAVERLDRSAALHDAGEMAADLRVLGGPIHSIRDSFELISMDTDDDRAAVERRLAAVPEALRGVQRTLDEAASRAGGPAPARRQALAVADQLEVVVRDGVFPMMAAGDERLASAALAAHDAHDALATWLRRDLAPRLQDRDGVGPERYRLWAASFLGEELDPYEAHAWGAEELARIEDEQAGVLRSLGFGSLLEAADALAVDPVWSIEGPQERVRWVQELTDRTIDALAGTEFDIPPVLRVCVAHVPSEGGASAAHYTSPSEDGSRPGGTWWPSAGRTRFSLWDEVTTVFHEAVPGHHLQLGTVALNAPHLTRYQRTTFVSGHGEGWALYAERLMDELGWFEEAPARLGYLASQGFRAARVVLDTALHLGLPHPDGGAFTIERARAFLREHGGLDEVSAASEVDRYLGWPGQAISYKLGERAWMDGRASAMARAGGAFDRRRWHGAALALGPLGLAQLRTELARL